MLILGNIAVQSTITASGGDVGRGGTTERSTYLGTLSVAKNFEYLFEGGDPSYLAANVGGAANDLFVAGSTVLPTFSEPQLSFASTDSITWPNDDSLAQLDATGDWGTGNYVFEFWYQQPNYTGHGLEANGTGASGFIQMIGAGNNSTRYLGKYIDGGTIGEDSYFPAGGRTGNRNWESFYDTYGDDTPHQLLEIHDATTRADFIVVLDGIPIASGSDSDGVLQSWDSDNDICFNGAAALADTERSGSTMGSFTTYDNGENFTLQMARELFEVSALANHDMLTVPKWVPLDAENVTVEPYMYNVVTMGDVSGATGVRSGAIPRGNGTGKIYFEFEIINQGDNTQAAGVGIRRLISIADVGALTDATEDGQKHHFYVQGNDIRYDVGNDTGIDIDGFTTGTSTGTTIMVAIDWNTGKFWIGKNGTWGDNGGDPATGANQVDIIDRDTNWAAAVINNTTSGNSVVRLKTHLHEFFYTPPTGFTAWTGNITPEAGGRGTIARRAAIDSAGVQIDREYLWEGTTTTYLYDDNETNRRCILTEGPGMGERTLGGAQLSYASADSVNWGNSSNGPDVSSNNAGISIGDAAHAWELWFRQPDLAQSTSCLIGSTNNSNVVMGKPTGAVNMPAARNNFNGDLRWESEIDVYGDNLPHQLIEAHDGADGTDYIVYLDGMPVASGTNSGFWGINSGSYRFNGDVTSGDGSDASGADFGSFTQYRGGLEKLSTFDVRNIFRASALAGHQMLSSPQWCALDSINCTIGGTGNKDITLGDVSNNTGGRSYAIPQTGRVYFEIEVVAQGDSTFGRVGLRKPLDRFNVGDDTVENASDIYYQVNTNFNDGDGSIGASGLVSQTTGVIMQCAIDWDTGNVWWGNDDTWASSGEPSTKSNPLITIDTDEDWCAWAGVNGAVGNQQYRLITAPADLNYAAEGFTPWEDADQSVSKYSRAVLADGPVGYWKLDEVSGTTAADAVGETHLTYGGGYTLNQTALCGERRAVDFDGTASTGASNLTPDSSLLILGDCTVEAWVNFGSFSGNSYVADISATGETEADNYLWSLTVSSTGFLRCFWEANSGTNQSVVSTTAQLTTGITSHIACVRDATAKTVTFFIDGVQYDSPAYSLNPTGGANGEMYIGRHESGGESDAVIDEVAVYDKKLTPTQIANHFNATQ